MDLFFLTCTRNERNILILLQPLHFDDFYNRRAEHLMKAQKRLTAFKQSLDNYLELAKFESRNGLMPSKSVTEKADEYRYKLNKWAKALRKVHETPRTDAELLEILADICPTERGWSKPNEAKMLFVSLYERERVPK